jgi:predicted dehydrogenase
MKKILIFGAGSIGNHMSFACVSLGFKVFITDKDPAALLRMKNIIYPKRYGKWNENISQIKYENVFTLLLKFDLIIIGTPPTSHYEIFINCKKKLYFKKILIEKPVSSFEDRKIFNLVKEKKYQIFCGYNHSVNPSMNFFFNQLKKHLSQIETVNISWREGWAGILGAHSWLKDEFESYLGDFKKGGGSIQEHSHGLHAMLCILSLVKIKKINLLAKKLLFKSQGKKKYDYFAIAIAENKNIFFKYETDLITFPPDKNVYIKLDKGFLKWICNYKENEDAVIYKYNKKNFIKTFTKTRSSEFTNELNHIFAVNSKKDYINSRVNIINGLKTLKMIKSIINKKTNDIKI